MTSNVFGETSNLAQSQTYYCTWRLVAIDSAATANPLAVQQVVSYRLTNDAFPLGKRPAVFIRSRASFTRS